MTTPKRKPKPKKGLSDRQQRFVLEYLVDGNATQAYIRAGYAARGQSASACAEKLLRNAEVKTAIDEGMSKTLGRLEITRERVLAELARIAFGNKRALMKWGPHGLRLNDSEGLDDDDIAQVAEVSETTTKDGGSLKLKTHDKVKALELLGRHLVLFTDKSEVTGANGGPIRTEDVRPPIELTDEELAARLAKYRP